MRVSFYEGAKTFVTPRRLALAVHGVPARQADVREEKKGPRVGAPENAIAGFLKAAGLKSISEAKVQPDKKGDFYVAVIEKPGRAAIEVIAEISSQVIKTFPWPKSMRWGEPSKSRARSPGCVRWMPSSPPSVPRPRSPILSRLPSTVSPSATRRAVTGSWRRRRLRCGMCGFDLTTIDGIGVDTAATVMSEIGPDLSAFPDEGHFVSYLRLAPNISISAGKKVPGKFRAVTSTRVCNALRMAATTLRNSKTALGAFYRRISRRKGASVAVFATARKLAQIVFRLIRYGQAYVDTGSDIYEARFARRRLASYAKALKEMGYKIEPLAA